MKSIKGIALNNKYKLDYRRVMKLVDTLSIAMNGKLGSRTILAVRMDFFVSIENQNLQDEPPIDVYSSFSKLLHSLYQAKLNGERILCIINWKKELSPQKGEHIHTVFYFSYDQVKNFGPKTKLFHLIADLWVKHTEDSCLPEPGFVHIVPAYLCESILQFRAQPYQGSTEQKYTDKHYYTVLTSDKSRFETLDEYHQQKHLASEPCGFMHWISYLAKKEQQAPLKKSFGTKRNLPKN